MLRSMLRTAAAVLLLMGSIPGPAAAASLEYPQVVKLRYEAVDQKQGGIFTIWLDRSTITQGIHPQLYPGASHVEVTFITPTAGSPLLTLIEVKKVSSPVPEYYHATGIVRFKVENMPLRSTNMPTP